MNEKNSGKSGKLVLDRLFSSVGAELFVRDYYGKKPLVTSGTRERFELETEHALFTADALLDGRGSDIFNGYLRRPSGKSFHIRLQSNSAKAFFDFGGTVEVDGVLASFPALRTMVQTLRDELGNPKASAVALVSPPGEALPSHFDQQDVFILQLSGRKRWRIAPNESVLHPLQSYFPAVKGEGRDGAVWPAYFPEVMPTEMPAEGRIDVVLEPGSVAYVPRGWWHQTEALDTSISVTVLCTPIAFVDLFVKSIRTVLERDEKMRRPVVMPFDPLRREQTHAEITELVAHAIQLVGEVNPSALVRKPFSEQRFTRPTGIGLQIEKDGEAQNLAKVTRGGKVVCEVEIDSDAVPLCEWLASCESVTGAVIVGFENSEAIGAEEVVEMLVDAGYLVRG